MFEWLTAHAQKVNSKGVTPSNVITLSIYVSDHRSTTAAIALASKQNFYLLVTFNSVRKGRTRTVIDLLLNTVDAFESQRDEATYVADKIVDSDNFL